MHVFQFFNNAKRQLFLVARFAARQASVPRAEQVRASIGALAGHGLAGALSMLWLGAQGAWLIAPMGASAVLLFCSPASPLAQPWAVIGAARGA